MTNPTSRRILVGFAALFVAAGQPSEAAQLVVSDAMIVRGKLIVKGTTPQARQTVMLDNRFTTTSSAARAFKFALNDDHLSDCIVSVRAGAQTATAVIVNCGPRGGTIATGHVHTCGITAIGRAKCWGNNHFGQLGFGTATNPLPPVLVKGLKGTVPGIAVGIYHSCALTATGGVKCWGLNDFGGLGDGTTMDRLTPVFVKGLESGVVALAAGDYHTCALTAVGGVKCWGYNGVGGLGDGTTTDRLTPVFVNGLRSGVVAIAAGNHHTCALTKVGGAKCWGANAGGQLGDGTTTDRLTPVFVNGLNSGVAAITTGKTYHTCALTKAGGAKCWGANDDGQLGDGTTTQRLTPVFVNGLNSGVAAIAVGGHHTCALIAGGAKCWGRNWKGQLGDGTTTDRLTPVNVKRPRGGVAALSAGGQYTCALNAAGGASCWGENTDGQLGDGTTTQRHTPVDVLRF